MEREHELIGRTSPTSAKLGMTKHFEQMRCSSALISDSHLQEPTFLVTFDTFSLDTLLIYSDNN